MLALLAMLGLVVGGTTGVFLHSTLYDQVDSKLRDAQGRTKGFFQDPDSSSGNNGSGSSASKPGGNLPGGGPPGALGNTIMAQFTPTDTKAMILTDSGPPYFIRGTENLPPAAVAVLKQVAANGKITTVDLGGTLNEYRVVAAPIDSVSAEHDGLPLGTIRVTGLPLKDTQTTLLQLAAVIAGAVLITLVIAGWAGAFIIRRSLKPLSRVASTASRVSELRLHRGEVNLAQRVPDADTDMRTEVGQVGAALNKMLDHVTEALEARHASEMQVRQFVADASHELRTPLAAIRGYAELSRRSRQPVPDEISHVLRRVESEAKRMTALVEDLLLLARLDAGRPLANDPVDLSMLVVDAVSDAHAAGPQHNWQLDLPDEPVTVIGDQQRLHQVLTNLLANARTHTPEGTYVCVAVNAVDDVAVIRVIDSGPGIPPELQPHIFERFARGDSSRSRAAGSTGLGLSIVNAVVVSHRGQVSVQSQPGHTQFTILLPLAVPAPGRAPISPHDYARITQ